MRLFEISTHRMPHKSCKGIQVWYKSCIGNIEGLLGSEIYMHDEFAPEEFMLDGEPGSDGTEDTENEDEDDEEKTEGEDEEI